MKKCLLSLCCVLGSCTHERPFTELLSVSESVQVVQDYLQEHRVDVNAVDDTRCGRTPLFFIDVDDDADQGYAVAQARILVQHGADVHARDCKGLTPLLALPGIGSPYAEDRGEVQGALDMLDFYISAGADVFARSNAGHNALDLAYSQIHDYSHNPQMVKKLKKIGLKSTIDRELVWCAMRGDVAGVRRLLAAGASPDACSVDGVPALIAAMDTPVTGGDPDNVKVIELLLQAGADPNAAETTYLNACALRYAEWNPPAVARLLLRYGANAKNLPVYDYGNDGNGYVSLMRKHGASIIKYQGVK
ncbi:MAG: hypothetical protein IKK15_01085 [Akkermansia sp.]|nr:hypothetical protein [Akkermansia sp.]